MKSTSKTLSKRRVVLFIATLLGLLAFAAVLGNANVAYAGGGESQRIIKVWNDEGNEASRPGHVTFELYNKVYDMEANGYVEQVFGRLELGKDSCACYKADGTVQPTDTDAFFAKVFSTDSMWVVDIAPCAYSIVQVKEVDIPEDYEMESTKRWSKSEGAIPEEYTDGYALGPEAISTATVITNKSVKKEEPKLKLTVNKTWEDDENASGKRPDHVLVHLFANGDEIDSAEISEAGNWLHTFENLPVSDGEGNEIAYTISEENVDGYTSEVGEAVRSEDEEGCLTLSFAITNTIVPEEQVKEEEIPEEPVEEEPVKEEETEEKKVEEKTETPEAPKPAETPKSSSKKELVQTDAGIPAGIGTLLGISSAAVAALRKMRF